MNAAAPDDACRADVWLWRARFFKTRALACRAIQDGRVRLTRDARETRLDKPSRPLRPGDQLVFAHNGRLTSVRVQSPGARRGPASEARALYQDVHTPPFAGEVGPRAEGVDGEVCSDA